MRPGEDWPRFLGPTQDGKSRETGLRLDGSQGLPILWQAELGDGYAAPVTRDGRLFLFDRIGNDARLRALDAGDGRELWRRSYETRYEDMYGYSGGPRCSPTVHVDRVLTFGAEGMLQARAVSDGRLLWQVDTAAVYGVRQNFFGVGSSPVVHGDLLIVQVGGSPEGSPGVQSGQVQANGSGIVAFDLADGRERYRFGDYLASYASFVTTTRGSEPWAFTMTRGGLLAFDPVRGRERFFLPWRAKMLESVNAATPVLAETPHGARVFITETYGPGGAVVEIGAAAPRIVWQDGRRQKSLASHWSTPIHVDGVLYGSSGRSTGNAELRAVRLADGVTLWSRQGLGRATLLYVDGHFVVQGEYGELWLVKADPTAYVEVGHWRPADATGKPLLAFPAWNAPILSRGVLYVRGKDRLLAVEAVPGT